MSSRDRAHSLSDTLGGARDPNLAHQNLITSFVPPPEHAVVEEPTHPSTIQTPGHPTNARTFPGSLGSVSSSELSEDGRSSATIQGLAPALPQTTFIPSSSRVLPSTHGQGTTSSTSFSSIGSAYESSEAPLGEAEQSFSQVGPAPTASPVFVPSTRQPAAPLSNTHSAHGSLHGPRNELDQLALLGEPPSDRSPVHSSASRANLELELSSWDNLVSENASSLETSLTDSSNQMSQTAPMLGHSSNTGIRRRLSITSAVSTLGLLLDTSNTPESCHVNSLASISDEDPWKEFSTPPRNDPDRFQSLINEKTWNSYQHLPPTEEVSGKDRAYVFGSYYISYDSHTENVSLVTPPPRPIPGTGGTTRSPLRIIRTPTPRIGPQFDNTALQSPQPLLLPDKNPHDLFARDSDGGLWKISRTKPGPFSMTRQRIYREMLSPGTVAAALRVSKDEFNLEVGSCSLTRVIGLANLEYVSECDTNLICVICYGPFVEPIVTKCDHTYCRECLNQALRINGECPTCRSPVGRTAYVATKVIRNMLDDMQVYCPLRARGCQEILPRSAAAHHVQSACGYLLVACPSRRCTVLIARKDLRDDACRHKMVQCEPCEELRCPEVDLAAHIEKVCPEHKITCLHCSRLFSRRILDEHVKECGEAVRPCKASTYGCDFTGARKECADHEKRCVLGKMIPWIERQDKLSQMLKETRKALMDRHLQAEKSLDRIEEILRDNELD